MKFGADSVENVSTGDRKGKKKKKNEVLGEEAPRRSSGREERMPRQQHCELRLYCHTASIPSDGIYAIKLGCSALFCTLHQVKYGMG